MPIRLFWDSVRHVERLTAEEDTRMMNAVLVASGAVQGAKEILEEFRAHMSEAKGTVMLFEEEASRPEDIMALVNGLK